MKRPFALLTGLAVALGGLTLEPASAQADDFEYSTASTAVQYAESSWSGPKVKIEPSYESIGEFFKSVVVTRAVDGAVMDTTTSTAVEAAQDKTMDVARAAHAPTSNVAFDFGYCLRDRIHASSSCQDGRAYTGTSLNLPKGVKAGQVSAFTLLDNLTVRAESNSGSYNRTKFGGWIDRNKDGENTRADVLKSESYITASMNKNGNVRGGKWISAYDNKVVTNASRIDIDHLVPLAEAWASGASEWTAKRRTAFANDLDYGPSLAAVSLSSNRSKGDRDIAEWVPTATNDVCTYVKQFLAAKTRWSLSVDKAEKTAASNYLANCASVGIKKPAKPVIAHLLPKPYPKRVVHKP